VRGWAAANGARARGGVYEEVGAGAAACPAHHPFAHDRAVAAAVRVVLRAGALPVGHDACGAVARDDARRRSTAATAVDTALHEKVLLGAVQLAAALVGGGKPGQAESQRWWVVLPRRPHWRARCVVPRVCSARARRGGARRFNRAAHRMNSTLGAECSGSSRSRSVCSLPPLPARSLRLITDGEATAATAASAAAATGCGEGGGEETVAAVSGCWAGTTAASVVAGAGVGGRCVRSVA
jgi:hypothetical protein